MRRTLILLVLMLHHDSPSYVIYSFGNTLFMVSYTTGHHKSNTTRGRLHPPRAMSTNRSPTNGNLNYCVVILRGSWFVIGRVFLLALRARNAFMWKFWTTIKGWTRLTMPAFVYRVISTKLMTLPGLKFLHTAIAT